MASYEERKLAIEAGQVRDKANHITAETYLTIRDQLVHADTTDGAMTVYLPPVALAAGKFFSVALITDGGDLTIADLDDSRNWEGDYTLDDAGEHKLFYSDGEKWYNVAAYVI